MARPRRDLTKLTGSYGKWTIVRKVAEGRFRQTHYLCTCACGTAQMIKATNLVDGKTRSCGRVGCRRRIGTKTVVGEITATRFSYLRRAAEIRRYEFRVTAAYLWNLFLSQNRRCALTGLELQIGRTIARISGNASLDRKDSRKGYLPGNVQWVHRSVNMMKGSMSNSEFIDYCRLVASHAKRLTEG